MRSMFIMGIACVLMAACATQNTVQQPKYLSAEESMAAKGLQSIDTGISKMNAFKTAYERGFLKDMTGTNTFNWNGRQISQTEAMTKFFMWREWIPKMETARAKLSSNLTRFSNDRTNELNKAELNKTLLEVDALLKEYNRQAY